jgi:hypothetical protein
VLDVTDPTRPWQVGAYHALDIAQAVAVSDGYAITTGSYSEGDQRKGIMRLIDVTDPTRPDPVSSIELPEHTLSSVVIAGEQAYVALADCYYFTCSGSLQTIDISDPAQPRLVGSLGVPGGALGLTMADGYVYLAAGDMGMWVIDVSDPAQARIAGSFNTPGRAYGVAVAGDLAYVADGQGGLLTLRVGIAGS